MHSALIVQLLVTPTAEFNAGFLRSPANALQLEPSDTWSLQHTEFGSCLWNHAPKGFTNIPPSSPRCSICPVQSIVAQQHSREIQPSYWMCCEQGIGKPSLLPSPRDSAPAPAPTEVGLGTKKKCWNLPNQQGTLVTMPTLGIS